MYAGGTGRQLPRRCVIVPGPLGIGWRVDDGGPSTSPYLLTASKNSRIRVYLPQVRCPAFAGVSAALPYNKSCARNDFSIFLFRKKTYMEGKSYRCCHLAMRRGISLYTGVFESQNFFSNGFFCRKNNERLSVDTSENSFPRMSRSDEKIFSRKVWPLKESAGRP